MEIKMETRLSTGMGLTISRAPWGAAGAPRGRLLSASPGALQQHLPGHPEWGMLGMGSGSGRPQTEEGDGGEQSLRVALGVGDRGLGTHRI